jgi:hypothetical protein
MDRLVRLAVVITFRMRRKETKENMSVRRKRVIVGFSMSKPVAVKSPFARPTKQLLVVQTVGAAFSRGPSA